MTAILLVAIPAFGAGVGLLIRGKPHALKVCVLLVTIGTLRLIVMEGASGTLAFGLLGVVIGPTAGGSVSSIALAIACATALPLVPFHKSYVAALSWLPGNLPAFLAVLLPVAGYDGLVTVLPQLPEQVQDAAAILALMGMVYGSFKPFAQSRAASVVAYGGVAF